MAPAIKAKQVSMESPDNSSGSNSDRGDGSWTYDGSVGSCTEPTTDTCSRRNTAKASPSRGGANNGNNSNRGTLAPSATPIVLTPAQAATSSDATATPTPPPPKSGVQNLAGAQQGTLSKPSASVDPAAPIVTSSTIITTKIITEENGEISTSSFTTVIPVTSFPTVASSRAGSSGSSGNKDTFIAAFIGGTVGAIVIVGLFVGIFLFLRKRRQSSTGRTTSSIAPSDFGEAHSDQTIDIGTQEIVGGELNQATSPSMTNASESSRVQRVPVPSMTDVNTVTDPFSDDATLGSFADFTLTSVDTFPDLKLAEAGRISNSSSFFQDEYLKVKLLQPEVQ